MNKILSTLAVAGMLFAVPVQAATPPTADQQARFLKQCLTVAPEAHELCTCKSEAIMKLVDGDFAEIIIASMKGKPLDAKYYVPYNDYIARSNKVCKPNY